MPLRRKYPRFRKLVHFLKQDKALIFIIVFCSYFFVYPEENAIRPQLMAPNPGIMQSCNSTTKICKIDKNPGGFYLQFSNTYVLLYRQKYKIVLDGWCNSSCTYFVNAMYLNDSDSVCITKKAQFGIHAGRIKDIANLPFSYIGELQELIDDHGGIPATDKPLYLNYDDLSTIYDTCQ